MPILVCRDGALASPVCADLPDGESALQHFAHALCALVLGGIFCDGLDRRDVTSGSLHEQRLIWPVGLGESLSSFMHGSLRMRVAGSLHRIHLANPRTVRVSTLRDAYANGAAVLSAVDTLQPQFLVQGLSDLFYRNWAAALSNLWIVVEQLTEFFWRARFLVAPARHPEPPVQQRLSTLRNDTRTYSTSVRHEILYQAGLLPASAFSLLSPARAARNKLAHEGRFPDSADCLAAMNGIAILLSEITGSKIDFSALDIDLERGPRARRDSIPPPLPDAWATVAQNFELPRGAV